MGLVHISEIDRNYVKDVREHLREGDNVEVEGHLDQGRRQDRPLDQGAPGPGAARSRGVAPTRSSSRCSRSSCARARSARSISGAPPSTSASSGVPMPREHRASDVEVVRDQLGREPTTRFEVVVRCPIGHPLVIRDDPLDVRGEPFPTTFWLTCPDAVKAVSRLEVRRCDPPAERTVRRRRRLPRRRSSEHTPRPPRSARGCCPRPGAWGGVGGTRRGIKCLHAHYANHLAGGDDVVGAWVSERVEPIHPEHADRGADRGGRPGDPFVPAARGGAGARRCAPRAARATW